MAILVTGAAGFIGMHVAARLIARGEEVVGFDNLNDYYDPRLKEARLAQLARHDAFRWVRGDLADPAAMAALGAGTRFTHVVHLAAQAGVRYSLDHPEAYAQSNLVGFVHVLELCRRQQVQHLVFASSSSVYGLNTVQPYSVHHNVDHPVSLYAATKKANELMAHSYSHLFGLPCTGLRFFTVYGPWGRPDMAYWSFTSKILAGEPIPVFNHGRLRRDFTWIEDIVEGVVRVADRIPCADPAWRGASPDPGASPAPYRLYNIGNSRPVELMDFIACLGQACGREPILDFQPMQPGDVLSTAADITDLERDVGFRPDTPLANGLERFVAWYRDWAGHC